MQISFKKAGVSDIPRLVEIENSSFNYDKLDAAKFRYAILKAHSQLTMILCDKVIAGYALIFLHRGTSLARLYSVAIHPGFRGQNLSVKLLNQIEKDALDSDCTYIRLEVKSDNKSAIGLYEKLNYVKFAYKADYYDDHSDAVCYEKKIRQFVKKPKLVIPYYAQTTDFTCGSASLMMAMKSLKPSIKMNRELELDLWREATTIFMTSGHGGCGPHGLALAACNRGFKVELFVNEKASLFIEGVRDKKKKKIIELVQKDFEVKLKKNKVKTHFKDYNLSTISKIIKAKGVALVLISAYRLTETKAPHWIVITGIEDDFIYFNDPELDKDQNKFDNMNIPVRIDEFEKMAKYGRKQLKSIVAIYKKSK